MRHASASNVLLSFALCIVAIRPVNAVAVEPVDFEQMVTFGDSLTDNDLLGIVFDSKPGIHGADPFEAVFHKGARYTDKLRSFAILGMESDNIPRQRLRYDLARIQGKVGPATVFGFEFGGNDALDNLELLASAPPDENQAADAVIDKLIQNYATGIQNLEQRFHPAKIVLWTVTDVTLIPDVVGFYGEVGNANIRSHIERANGFIRAYKDDVDKIVVDLYDILQESVANPPVIYGHALVGPPAFGDFDNLFADPIHPTAVGNAIIANVMIGQINAKWGNQIPFYTEAELANLARIPKPSAVRRGLVRVQISR